MKNNSAALEINSTSELFFMLKVSHLSHIRYGAYYLNLAAVLPHLFFKLDGILKREISLQSIYLSVY